jgi:hypothetical protein
MESQNKELQEIVNKIKQDNTQKQHRKDHFMNEVLGIEELR